MSAEKRICVLHANDTDILAKVTAALSESSVVAVNVANKAKGENAYTVVDANGDVSAAADKIAAIAGVRRVRVI
jgi:D-3-phosphoglycerate dehydrogenase